MIIQCIYLLGQHRFFTLLLGNHLFHPSKSPLANERSISKTFNTKYLTNLQMFTTVQPSRLIEICRQEEILIIQV